MKTVAYARVSTHHQQFDAQLNALNKYGYDQLYMEQESGRKTNRHQLELALKTLNPGDTFVIFKLDRLSRGTKHLLQLMEYFDEQNIEFVSIQNNINTKTPMGRFFFTVMSAFAEMEAELISERVISGLNAARNNGKQLGRPPINKNIELVLDLYVNTNMSIAKISRTAQISRSTVYRYLEKNNIPLKTK